MRDNNSYRVSEKEVGHELAASREHRVRVHVLPTRYLGYRIPRTQRLRHYAALPVLRSPPPYPMSQRVGTTSLPTWPAQPMTSTGYVNSTRYLRLVSSLRGPSFCRRGPLLRPTSGRRGQAGDSGCVPPTRQRRRRARWPHWPAVAGALDRFGCIPILKDGRCHDRIIVFFDTLIATCGVRQPRHVPASFEHAARASGASGSSLRRSRPCQRLPAPL